MSVVNLLSLLNCVAYSELVFTAELCCPHRIRCSLPNCVVCSESGVHCPIVYFTVNQVFSAEFCCRKRIRFSLLNLCCPRGIRCSLPNCVLHSKSGVHCRIVLFAVNQVFATKFVLSAVNQVFASELCIA